MATAIRALVCVLAVSMLAAATAAAGPSRKLMQVHNNGPRKFETVAMHKMPEKPVLSRRDFDAASARVAGLAAGGTRNLLQGGGGASNGGVGPRRFETVANHKTPSKPALNRNSFDTASRAFAATSTATRNLLQSRGPGGPRKFETVAQHKTPSKPTLTRQSFDTVSRAFAATSTATRNLLQGGGGASNGGVGPRKFEMVDQHKTPEKPVLSRKGFEVATNMFHGAAGSVGN